MNEVYEWIVNPTFSHHILLGHHRALNCIPVLHSGDMKLSVLHITVHTHQSQTPNSPTITTTTTPAMSAGPFYTSVFWNHLWSPNIWQSRLYLVSHLLSTILKILPCVWIWKSVLQTLKQLEGPLDRKEIKPVNPKRNQHWIFFGRMVAEAEVSILWPPEAKSLLSPDDSDAGKDWG